MVPGKVSDKLVPYSEQMGNSRMEVMAETNLLDIHLDTPYIIIIGKGKKVEDEFAANSPLS